MRRINTTARHKTSKNVETAVLYARERTLTTIALTCLVFAFATYIYFLSVSVVNVVMRQEIDGEISKISNDISMLETRYIVAQGRVTPTEAVRKGFSESPEKVYVTREASGLTLRVNDES